MDNVDALRNLSGTGVNSRMQYYPDPIVYNFSEDNSIKRFKGEVLIFEVSIRFFLHIMGTSQLRRYRKVPKFSDTRIFGCNLPKIQTKRSNLRVFCQNDALRSSLIWVCTVCPYLSVQKLKVIKVPQVCT